MKSRLALAALAVAAVGFVGSGAGADHPVRARRELPCRYHLSRFLEHRGPLCDRSSRPWRGLRF